MICLIRREGFPPRSAWRGIAVSGVLWFGFYMVVLNWGEQQVDAGTAALVVNIGPILIALLGARLLGDAMPPRLLAGMAVSFAGAVDRGPVDVGRGRFLGARRGAVPARGDRLRRRGRRAEAGAGLARARCR